MKKLFLSTMLICWINCGFSQTEYPQVTKIKQKCYEIYNKADQSPQETRDLVYKRINYICDSIVNASTLDYPYIDLQVVSKKQIVAQAKILAAQDFARYKEGERLRLEKEAREKAEAERIAVEKAKEEERLRLEKEAREKAEAERIAAENRKKELLLASLPAAKDKALSFAKKYEDMFPAEAHQICNDIFDMYLKGSLRHIKTQTANGVEYMGWVDQQGLPCGIARISKPVRPGVESIYTGIFYEGKPILGELKLWAPQTEDKFALHGFVNLQRLPYNSKPTYVRYQQNGYHIHRLDGKGNINGLCIDRGYKIIKNTIPVVDINLETEKVIKQLYNYFVQQYPQTSTKVVENFPLGENYIYTGGWKDGEPDGVGVIKYPYRCYKCQYVNNGVVVNAIVLDNSGTYQFYSNDNEVYADYTIQATTNDGILIPHNNNGIGISIFYNLKQFTLANIKLKDGISIDPANISNEILFDYLNSSVIKTDTGYAYFRNYDIDGTVTDYAGIGAKGTFTIEQFDNASKKTDHQNLRQLWIVL